MDELISVAESLLRLPVEPPRDPKLWAEAKAQLAGTIKSKRSNFLVRPSATIRQKKLPSDNLVKGVYMTLDVEYAAKLAQQGTELDAVIAKLDELLTPYRSALKTAPFEIHDLLLNESLPVTDYRTREGWELFPEVWREMWRHAAPRIAQDLKKLRALLAHPQMTQLQQQPPPANPGASAPIKKTTFKVSDLWKWREELREKSEVIDHLVKMEVASRATLYRWADKEKWDQEVAKNQVIELAHRHDLFSK